MLDEASLTVMLEHSVTLVQQRAADSFHGALTMTPVSSR